MLAVAYSWHNNVRTFATFCVFLLHNRYERMYLHVDIDDPAAAGLYSSMGYESMEQYDAPLWMRQLFGMPTIRYQVKQFKGRRVAP